MEENPMAKDKNEDALKELKKDIEKAITRLNLVDDRMDNLDSVVSAAVERVMNQALTMRCTCPSCGKEVELGLVGMVKPGFSKR